MNCIREKRRSIFALPNLLPRTVAWPGSLGPRTDGATVLPRPGAYTALTTRRPCHAIGASCCVAVAGLESFATTPRDGDAARRRRSKGEASREPERARRSLVKGSQRANSLATSVSVVFLVQHVYFF
jgi:hypothetical protein